jgi:hypothetical protein
MLKRWRWLVAAALGLAASPAGAWWHTGHCVVAQIAWERLADQPALRQTWSDLTAQLVGKYQPYTAITGAAWFDDVRDNQTAPLHFIDVPYGAGGKGYQPPPPTAVGAISTLNQALATLRGDPAADGRAEAFGRVLNLVADLHMPLHCCDNNDQGGNKVLVAGIPHAANLHLYWDQAYRIDEVDGKIGDSFAELTGPTPPDDPELKRLADDWQARYPPAKGRAATSTNPLVWHREGWELACRQVYDPLAGQDMAAPVHLPPGYVHQAHETAQRQLVLAGFRLAEVLRATLAPRSRRGLSPATAGPLGMLAAALVLIVLAALPGRRRRGRPES